jgi:hypothetical protein
MSSAPAGIDRKASPKSRRAKAIAALLAAAGVWTLASRVTAVAVTPSTPGRIAVPAGLARQNSSIEPSGVVWVEALQRFLVISDDTGSGEKHQPWVFAMTRQGAFDDTPVPILGIDEVNDPEAICSGPDGTFFFTTSHSENKKGKTKAARRVLLHLRLEGRALRALGQIDLTTARDGKGGGLLEIAGLDPLGKLDIEALTYRQGALLIGLKAPLTAGGSAVILQLKSPVDALRSGRIEPGALTRYREVTLNTSEAMGRPVHRGISDLTSLADGSIVLLANSPKDMPSDGGGAMYWLKPGAGAAVLLEDFPGFKPEGVTLSEDGRGLVLVFDNDLRPPLWTRCGLPK